VTRWLPRMADSSLSTLAVEVEAGEYFFRPAGLPTLMSARNRCSTLTNSSCNDSASARLRQHSLRAWVT